MKIKLLKLASLAVLAAAALLGFTSCVSETGSTSRTQSTTAATPGSPRATVPSSPASTEMVPMVEATRTRATVERVAKAAEPGLRVYRASEPLSGTLRVIGSDTMDELLMALENAFKVHHPQLRIRHEGKGSSSAVPALIENRAEIGPMSRRMRAQEVDAFRERFGYDPVQLPIAVDALAVYVHPDNPILKTGLNMSQLERIFAAGPRFQTWGELGLTGAWANAPIRLHSRNSASGTFGFFQAEAIRGRDFHEDCEFHPGSASVVEAVSLDKFAIGYSGIAYKTPGVATVKLSRDSMRFFDATEQGANSGDYPLARQLYLTLNPRTNQGGITPTEAEFLKFCYSKEGQAVVTTVGYFPISKEIAEANLNRF